MQNSFFTMENNLALPQKFNIELPHDPTVLLGMCPKELKTEQCYS